MPRIAEPRAPAEPTTPTQHARRDRILAAATRLGTERELERVPMQEVAREADVALSTLYRYFPSKTHLFVGVMAAEIDRMVERFADVDWSGTAPDEAVFEVIRAGGRAMVRRPTLAAGLIRSANAADPTVVTDIDRIDQRLLALLLEAARVERASTRERTLMRLVLQSWYGMLQSALNGRIPLDDSEADLRVACRLLLAPLRHDEGLPTADAGRARPGAD